MNLLFHRPLLTLSLIYATCIAVHERWSVALNLVFAPLAAAYLIWLHCADGRERRICTDETTKPGSQSAEVPQEEIGSVARRRIYGVLLVCVALVLVNLRHRGTPVGDIHTFLANEGAERLRECTIIGRVVSDPAEVEDDDLRFLLESERLIHHHDATRVTGRLLVTSPRTLAVRYGDRLHVDGDVRRIPDVTNPGEIPAARFLPRGRLSGRMFIKDVRQVSITGEPPRVDIGGFGVALRHWTLQLYKRTMPPPYADLAAKLMCSIVYGISASPLPEVIQEPFRRAGVMHVLVASGTQVSLIVLMLLFLFRGLRLNGVVQASILVPIVLLYAMVAGSHPSILRAAVMGIIVVFALWNRRDCDHWTTLGAAALGILAINPDDLFSIGFQLSFAAVIGLMAMSPRLVPHLSAAPHWLALTTAYTVGAQLMVLPLLAHYFGYFSLVGFVSNLVIVPWAGVLVATGLATCMVGAVSPFLAEAANVFNAHVVFGLFNATNFFARAPHATIDIVPPPGEAMLAYYVLLFVGAGLLDEDFRRRWRWERVLVYLAVAGACVAVFLSQRSFRDEMTVTFVDMGQGEAIVVRSPSGRIVLIDGGSANYRGRDVAQRVLLPYLLSAGVRRLDAVVISHPHDDHINALPTVLRELPVSAVLTGGLDGGAAAMEEITKICRQRRIPLQPLSRRAQLDLGRGVKAYMLLPMSPPLQGTESDLNNNSIVLKLCYGKTSLLLTGDLENEGEKRLLKRGDNLKSTLLKVGHQGAATSTSTAFLRAVHPDVAVISVGAMNSFGHPRPETVQRIRDSGAQIYRTDVDGAITFRTNGTSYNVETFK